MPNSDALLVRSALFVPAIRERFIEKAPDAGADLVCLDLEDSVALAEKLKGREMARDSMPGMRRHGLPDGGAGELSAVGVYRR